MELFTINRRLKGLERGYFNKPSVTETAPSNLISGSKLAYTTQAAKHAEGTVCIRRSFIVNYCFHFDLLVLLLSYFFQYSMLHIISSRI